MTIWWPLVPWPLLFVIFMFLIRLPRGESWNLIKMWCCPAILGRCFFPNCVDTWKFTNCLKAQPNKNEPATSYNFQHPKTMTMGEVNPQWHPKRNIVQKNPKAPGTPAAPTVAGGTQQMPIQMLLRWDWQNLTKKSVTCRVFFCWLALQKNPMSYQVSFHG